MRRVALTVSVIAALLLVMAEDLRAGQGAGLLGPEETAEKERPAKPGERMTLPDTEYMETEEEETPPKPAAPTPTPLRSSSSEVQAVKEGPAKKDAAKEEPTKEGPAKKDAAKEEPRKKGVTILKKGAEAEEEDDHRFTIHGGTLIHPEDTAVSLSLGVPEVKLMYHFALSGTVDVAVGAGFFYGFNPDSIGDVTGGGVVSQFRWRVYASEGHSLSLTAEPQLQFLMDPKFGAGFIFALPGLAWDYRIVADWSVNAGLSIPWGAFVTGNSNNALRIPLLGKVGMEYAVSEDFHVFGQVLVGPDIWTGRYLEDVYLQMQVLVGAAFLL